MYFEILSGRWRFKLVSCPTLIFQHSAPHLASSGPPVVSCHNLWLYCRTFLFLYFLTFISFFFLYLTKTPILFYSLMTYFLKMCNIINCFHFLPGILLLEALHSQVWCHFDSHSFVCDLFLLIGIFNFGVLKFHSDELLCGSFCGELSQPRKISCIISFIVFMTSFLTIFFVLWFWMPMLDLLGWISNFLSFSEIFLTFIFV